MREQNSAKIVPMSREWLRFALARITTGQRIRSYNGPWRREKMSKEPTTERIE